MPKKAKELGPLDVKRLVEPGLHAVGGVAGLHLQVLPSGGKSWVLRIVIGGKRCDVGLGGFPDVPLAMAREKAREVREAVQQGRDPIAERATARSLLAAQRGAEITFDECARKFIEAKSAEWKSAKHAAQWSATLETYASPVIGTMQVRDIELAHIVKILEKDNFWTTKTETASRVRGRIESVLDWATVRGFRKGANPARWKGHLDKLLPAPKKVSKIEHHAALPVDEMGAFIRDLRQREAIAARALEVLILTAARSGEIRGMTWDEVDLDAAVWVVPAERMKAKREHRVPLSTRAIEVLRAQPVVAGDLVFPGMREGAPLSDMTLTAVLKRMGRPDLTAHGFRSTFRDWAAERTNYPREVAEAALAHTIENKVEAAYRRGDLFEKRCRMMEDWSKFCDTIQVAGEVVPIRAKAVA
ncbi:tyrosine-type recombinase/integrase [Thauera aromatica]|uniref:tyrosine-type recombinase/integrase n=1 Tax=Thauera aromatica TaxID=59405 RepID=UPI001FFC4830|nr:site-specific integrase [Thauera aromatica]MCK2096874.1 integrase arm-type DNA-binding domain-containing protein [Thauera aromatica]